MSNIVDAYVGEIRMFAGRYAPQGWHFCDGGKLPISGYEAFYSLIGTTYGGDATTFGLPDLRGRVPIGQGQGTGLTARTLAQNGGAEAVALSSATIPAHTHTFNTTGADATTGTLLSDAGGGTRGLGLAKGTGGAKTYMNNATVNPVSAALATTTVSDSGQAGLPHSNMMPSFVVNFIICVDGLYPQRP